MHKVDNMLTYSSPQVMAEDQRSKAGVFYTGQSGGVPPLITTSFVTVDQGNSSPRFIRSSMYNIPATIDMMKQVGGGPLISR